MITMKEVELELCMIDIYESLLDNMYLHDDEILDYQIDEDIVQFLMISGGDDDDGRITMVLTLLFSYDFSTNEGEFGDDLMDMIPFRMIEDLEDELDRISEEYQEYEDMFS